MGILAESAKEPRSLLELFRARAAQSGGPPALQYRSADTWRGLTWREAYERTERIACGLIARGVGRADRVAILSSTRVEWVLADLAIGMAGGVTVPLHSFASPEECARILRHSGAVLVFADNTDQLAKLVNSASAPAVLFSGDAPGATSLAELEREAPDVSLELEARRGAARPSDPATIVFGGANGSGGLGKVLTHDNLRSQCAAIDEVLGLGPDDVQLVYLPLSHLLPRILCLAALHSGSRLVFAGSFERLQEDMAEVGPTYVASAPRIFRGIYEKFRSATKESGRFDRKVLTWAMGVGQRLSRERQMADPTDRVSNFSVWLSQKLVFRHIKRFLGGRLRYAVMLGAPLEPEVAEFFHSADLLLLQGFGVADASGLTHLNRPDRFRFGTLGPPLPGVEVKLTAQGEMCVRGPNVIAGYEDHDGLRPAVDSEGWLATGQAAEIDERGFLQHVARLSHAEEPLAVADDAGA
jgi:long-chain acyl-CoA synthetase